MRNKKSKPPSLVKSEAIGPNVSYMLNERSKPSDMGRMKQFLLLSIMLLAPLASFQHVELQSHQDTAVSARATGVDITITDVSYSYTNESDESKYRMFSSNFPVPGFNKPEMLYVVDAVVNVPIFVEITVENIGSSQSGSVVVNLLQLHNEYSLFELMNTTLQMPVISAGSSNVVSTTFTPTYSGNHSMIITADSSIIDDNPQNNAYSNTLTVANSYFNCDDLTSWSVGTEWGLSSETGLSFQTSCHVGNGQSSTYSNNLATSLVTPVMDMSDAVENPTRTNGMSFFYTGAVMQGDVLKMQAKSANGIWSDVGSISNIVDQNLVDGQDYKTFSINHAGAISPLVPVGSQFFHSQSQFQFLFQSDASGADIGYYIDEFVIMYDQKVRAVEYAVSASGISTTGSVPGQWGVVQVELTNEGNISESFMPSITGLPNLWDAYYSNSNGVSINEQTGVLLAPGQTKIININIKPDQNASTGMNQMEFTVRSSSYSDVNFSLAMQFQVLPDRLPSIQQPEYAPSCPPGTVCAFSIEVRNIGDATDVFELSIDRTSLPDDWNVQFAWSQDSNIYVRTDTPATVDFTLSVPANAMPDTRFSFILTAESQNNSIRSDSASIDVAASMISDASIGMTVEQLNRDWMIDAGGTKSIQFTIWNNASRQDIFSIEMNFNPDTNWNVGQPTVQNAVINAQSSTTIAIEITAPLSGQAGDEAPTITPKIQSTRSSMIFQGEAFSGIEVRTISDLQLRLIEAPSRLKPGIPTPAVFEIENNGNGEVGAILVCDPIPDSWEWWIQVDGVNHTQEIELSAPYDDKDVVEVHVVLLLPSEERAGEVHSLTCMVSSSLGLSDQNIFDNSVQFDSITSAVRIPGINANTNQVSAMVGDVVSVNITAFNIGNAVDNDFLVKATYSSSPPSADIVAFFSLGAPGASRSLDEYHLVPMQPGEEILLTVDLVLPQSLLLNTRIVVVFEVIGGMNEEMMPYELQHEILIEVDEQRKMSAEIGQSVDFVQVTGYPSPFWINITSESTQAESYILSLTSPDGWTVLCQGEALNQSGQLLNHASGHITPANTDMFCEVHRSSGPLESTIEVMIDSNDAYHERQFSLTFTFEEQVSTSVSYSTQTIASSAAVLIVIIASIVFFTRRNTTANEESEEAIVQLDNSSIQVEHITISGPPIQSGPPASTHTYRVAAPEMQVDTGPPLPASGLPNGWTMEQWRYYGQQYLDAKQ